MDTVEDLFSKGIKDTRISILVFGPQVSKLSLNERTRNLQNKRIQIREKLEDLGHYVKYAEDLVDPNLPSQQSNAFLQELVIMPEYDLIINIVDSPGSIVEATAISMKPDLAQKATLFMDSEYLGGLVAETCQFAELAGADFNTYDYPNDLIECHLLGFVEERVRKVQFVKMIL